MYLPDECWLSTSVMKYVLKSSDSDIHISWALMLVQLEGDELGSILTRSIFMGVEEALDVVYQTDKDKNGIHSFPRNLKR